LFVSSYLHICLWPLFCVLYYFTPHDDWWVDRNLITCIHRALVNLFFCQLPSHSLGNVTPRN
jgi:hypothetical protein